jgi:hypothetical protein
VTLQTTQANLWAAVRVRPEPLEAKASFRPTQGLSIEAALEVYRTAYWVRQVAALQETFALTCAQLGLQRFNQIASRFITQHPSHVWALERLGAAFPQWVGEQGGNAALAGIEYARLECIMAPDAPTVPPTALATIQDFAQVRLEFAPHLRLVTADAPTLEGLHHAAGVGLAIWRVDHHVYERPLQSAEWSALTLAKSASALGLVLEPLMPLGDLAAAQCVAQWCADGWVQSLSLCESSP